eukprot:11195468-Lingulodinium_polyedra.AAC.1
MNSSPSSCGRRVAWACVCVRSLQRRAVCIALLFRGRRRTATRAGSARNAACAAVRQWMEC